MLCGEGICVKRWVTWYTQHGLARLGNGQPCCVVMGFPSSLGSHTYTTWFSMARYRLRESKETMTSTLALLQTKIAYKTINFHRIWFPSWFIKELSILTISQNTIHAAKCRNSFHTDWTKLPICYNGTIIADREFCAASTR